MFIKPIVKWFFLCTFISNTTFSIVPTTLAFSNQFQEENKQQLVEPKSDKSSFKTRKQKSPCIK